MPEPLQNRVLSALSRYAEGGTIRAARTEFGVSAQQFYDALEADPALQQRYRFIQKSRADMFVDEACALAETGTDDGADPRRVRVAADIKLKLAGFYDRPRFGEKIGVEIEAGPNLADALAAAKRRAPLPICDLGQVTDAEFRALPAVPAPSATDNESVGAPSGPPEAPASDPLGLFDDE